MAADFKTVVPASAADGIICAFVVKDDLAQMVDPSRESIDPSADYVWLHLNLATQPGRRWIMTESGLPQGLASAFLDPHLDHSVEPMRNGVLLAIEDRERALDSDLSDMTQLRVWIEPHRLISGRWRPVAAAHQIQFRLQVGKPPPNAAGLAADLIESLTADMESLVRAFSHRLDTIEDQILDGGIDGVAAELGAIRRDAIRTRRRAHSLRHVVVRLSEILQPWLVPEDRQAFAALPSRLDRTITDLHECQEQARLLGEETQARNNERNSRNLYIISLLTVVMLPLNIITGIFGMNVAGLPGLHDPDSFVWVMISMIATPMAVLWLFRVKRWF